jgi:hypothetical protein
MRNCPDVYNPDQNISVWYKDFDDDGYSDGSTPYTSCNRPKICLSDLPSVRVCTPVRNTGTDCGTCSGGWSELYNGKFAFKSIGEKLCSNDRTKICTDNLGCTGGGICEAALISLGGDANDTNAILTLEFSY